MEIKIDPPIVYVLYTDLHTLTYVKFLFQFDRRSNNALRHCFEFTTCSLIYPYAHSMKAFLQNLWASNASTGFKMSAWVVAGTVFCGWTYFNNRNKNILKEEEVNKLRSEVNSKILKEKGKST